jgi:hypothetical protein
VRAGNARTNCVRCCPRKGDRHRSAFLPRPRKPGLKSRATGESPFVRTVSGTPTGERARSGGSAQAGTPWRAPHPLVRTVRSASVGVPLPSFFFRPFFFRHCEEQSDEAIQCGATELDCFAEPVIGPNTSGRTRWLAMTRQDSRADASRENASLFDNRIGKRACRGAHCPLGVRMPIQASRTC